MKKLLTTVFSLFLVITAFSQHEHHMPARDSASRKKDSAMKQPHQHHEGMDMSNMTHSFSRNLPMSRNGSGTSWLPDESPMYGYMYHSKKWMYMVHGNIFLRYTNQDIGNAGSRGGNKIDFPNWFMGMAQRNVGKRGLFRVSAMLSLDRLTEGGNGYPLLFQSGESWKGKPLVDRQHPHDLFAELSIGYSHMINKDIDIFGYLAYPGEPAIGGVAFMHRPSSLYNPDAPLGHHWQDATHITFGVATIGFRYKNLKLEGSSFTGREPDEDRYNFDKARFDSWSMRLSYNPSKEWALQVSQGYINSPEALHPETDIRRTTASVIHSKRFRNSIINSALVWGYNRVDSDHKEHSLLFESAFNWNRNTIYGKYEFVEKSTEELALDENIYGHHEKFPVSAITLGVNRRLFTAAKTDFSIGTQASLYLPDKKLQSLYGRSPVAFQAFIRINPSIMN
jgi:hypothetical protein